MVVKDLEKLGLEHKEAKVYLALLALGETHIVPLANKLDMPRNSVVYLLEGLREKHLIQILKRKSRRVYVPNSPEIFVKSLREKKELIAEQESEAKTLLPELKRLYSTSATEPSMRLFKGQDELRQIYDEMVDSGAKEIIYIGEYDKIVEVIGKRYLENVIKKRVARGIKTRSIRVKSHEVNESIFQSPKETIREIHYAPEGFKSPGHVTIWNNTVAVITTAKENFGFVVTSEEYAETMRNWFYELWKISK